MPKASCISMFNGAKPVILYFLKIYNVWGHVRLLLSFQGF